MNLSLDLSSFRDFLNDLCLFIYFTHMYVCKMEPKGKMQDRIVITEY